jgi:NADPH:quinone reductase-like Zn-dependent oxidoreductase
MRAIVRTAYGTPELREIDKPVPEDHEVLVRVRAASVNPVDWYGLTGRPYVARVQTGIRAPKEEQIGVDLAGTVEAVGGNVTRLQPGDEVFGGRTGALAEYVRARDAVAPKPANLTFEQAAAVPVAGLTALQGLRDKGQLRPGQKVLINGASGRRDVRRPDRQVARGGGDRGVQHAERGYRPRARRRPRLRLHP